MLFGDLLALISAVTFAFYGIMGRSQRHRYPLLSYSGTIYLVAGLWLLPFALLTFSGGGYTAATVTSLLGLGLLPLGLGHTLYNAALRLLNATVVNILAMQEVTISIALAALLLGEIPAISTLAGVALTLVGVILVVL
jgi:drug/metabolite transporter (DMT)-like permease